MDIIKILDEETKLCPECAETIKLKAKKCRYCHTRFNEDKVVGEVKARYAELIAQKKRELLAKKKKELLAKKKKELLAQKKKELLAKEREELLAKKREGKIQCPNCGKWDVYKTMTNDFGYDDYCPHCKQSLKSMGVIEEKKPPPPKKPSALFYVLVCIALVGALSAYIIPLLAHSKPQPLSAFYLSLWIGILTAMTARKRGKSGWLWFFFGFIVIGFTTIFLISIFHAFLGGHNKPINAKLIKMKPVFENASIQNLQAFTNRLDQIEDINTIQNINKAIKIIELSQDEVSKVGKAFNEIKLFVNENQDELKNENFDIFVEMMEMNEEIGTFGYFRTYKEYLIVFKKFLIFSRDHFDAIIKGKKPETREYDVLYANYQSAENKLNDANLQKQMAIKEYLKKHPKFISHMQQAQKRLDKAGN